MAKVMACHRTAPSHYLNQRDMITMRTYGKQLRAISHEVFQVSIDKSDLETMLLLLLGKMSYGLNIILNTKYLKSYVTTYIKIKRFQTLFIA